MDQDSWHGLTASAGLTASLLTFAVKRGADRDTLLAVAGIDEALLGDPDARVSFARYVTLMRAAKAQTGDPALALHFGAADDMAHHSVVGLLGMASRTMRDALAQLNRYGQLVVEVDLRQPGRFLLEQRGEGLWLVDCRERANRFPELTESTFARMTAGARYQFGGKSALRVRVTHPAPRYAALCEEVFGAPVEYASERNELLLSPGWTETSVARQPRYAFGILARHADALLAELQASHTLRGKVEAALMPVLHRGAPGIEAIARQLGMSRATLYRRLRDEGVTFAQLLDALRQRLALDYLAAGKVSVNETAYLTGFSDPAAFSRAVKRWTGHSPGSLRGISANRQP